MGDEFFLIYSSLFPLGTSWGISWQNNCINYLDFLRALESSKPPRPESKEKEAGVPINFERLRPEDVLKNVQKVVAGSSPALSTVRPTAECFSWGN